MKTYALSNLCWHMRIKLKNDAVKRTSHSPVSSSTIARWIKTVLTKSGVNTDIFKAHSVRSTATSATANAGTTTSDILKAADWSSESVFQKFYYKLENKALQFYLSCQPLTNNYMKNVMSNISTSHPCAVPTLESMQTGWKH